MVRWKRVLVCAVLVSVQCNSEDSDSTAAPWLKRSYFGHSDELMSAQQMSDKSSESQWYYFECDTLNIVGYHGCGLMNQPLMKRIPLFGSRVHLESVESAQQLHTITDDWYAHSANLTTDAHQRYASSLDHQSTVISMRWRIEPGIVRQSITLSNQQNRKLACDDRGRLFVSRSDTHLMDFSWFAIKHARSVRGAFILEHALHHFVLSVHDDGHVYVIHRSLFDHTRSHHWSFQNIAHSNFDHHQSFIHRIESIRQHM